MMAAFLSKDRVFSLIKPGFAEWTKPGDGPPSFHWDMHYTGLAFFFCATGSTLGAFFTRQLDNGSGFSEVQSVDAHLCNLLMLRKDCVFSVL